jgi:hypothetical protein
MRHSLPIHTAKTGFICALFMLLATAICSETVNPEQTAPQVISALSDSLNLDQPVLLDIRCGEWTSALELELRRQLLLHKIDIRETNAGLLSEAGNLLIPDPAAVTELNGEKLLQSLDLTSADLLELTMEQSFDTGEKRNLISYSKYRQPVYRFTLKQIELPGQRLVAMREYRLSGSPEVENPGSLLAMKWYEPILTGAILGSLVYALWSLK